LRSLGGLHLRSGLEKITPSFQKITSKIEIEPMAIETGTEFEGIPTNISPLWGRGVIASPDRNPKGCVGRTTTPVETYVYGLRIVQIFPTRRSK
jgi:hypothetical protein